MKGWTHNKAVIFVKLHWEEQIKENKYARGYNIDTERYS